MDQRTCLFPFSKLLLYDLLLYDTLLQLARLSFAIALVCVPMGRHLCVIGLDMRLVM